MSIIVNVSGSLHRLMRGSGRVACVREMLNVFACTPAFITCFFSWWIILVLDKRKWSVTLSVQKSDGGEVPSMVGVITSVACLRDRLLYTHELPYFVQAFFFVPRPIHYFSRDFVSPLSCTKPTHGVAYFCGVRVTNTPPDKPFLRYPCNQNHVYLVLRPRSS